MTLLNKTNHEPDVQNNAPEELRALAGLTLKKRLLREQLAEVESQCRQLYREIELKGIPIPWLS